ncbi:ornithine cyclodeaminase family protein [Fervidicoccus fontis]|uniref:Ornithine cyclodeaminase/mu-crystallin n=2 Tax=Fervidicoccus fontis TaxID=683846 RepID=I0A1B4_FERFK|nr:ornithine cyclodeaminase family protein [Fervidicoccus fontis]AFH42771.1 ornithine cyclodeaminase/mu-crystallin [Fervidicoccus fontis Kam940]MBE9391568.1 ornithine cyclodeaminase family protein [Fervidicoccus fontis]
MSPSVLLVSGNEIENLMDLNLVSKAIEDALIKFSKRETLTPERTVMRIKGNWWAVMQSYIPSEGIGVKVVSQIPENFSRGLPTIQAVTLLFNESNGELIGIFDGNILTALRTGAASAISIKYLAPKNTGPIGIIGTGYQAKYQLKFSSLFYKTRELMIFDINKNRENEFKTWAESLGYVVSSANSIEELVKSSKVVIEATTTKTPIILGEWLDDDKHIISIGAHSLEERALDDEAIKKIGKIVVDSRNATLNEAGDIAEPVKKGILDFEDITEIGEIAAGKKKGREGNEITLFKSVGLAVEDVAVALLAYNIAKSKGLGKEIIF